MSGPRAIPPWAVPPPKDPGRSWRPPTDSSCWTASPTGSPRSPPESSPGCSWSTWRAHEGRSPGGPDHLCETVAVTASSFALTDEQRQFQATMRQFAEERIAPNAAEVDRAAEFPWKSFAACCEMELPSLGIPEAYGGAGADMVTQAIVAEELSRVCASTSLTILISKLGMLPVMNWGSEELKKQYLHKVAAGEIQASYCLSE